MIDDWKTAQRTAIPRRLAYFGCVTASTAAAAYWMSEVVGATGATWIQVLAMVLFTINFAWISCSFWTAMAGFVLRSLGRDPITLRKIDVAEDAAALSRVPIGTTTAIVMPVHNEDTQRVFAGLEATYRSVQATGQIDHFEFFVLSDTRDATIAKCEEVAWAELIERVGGKGRIFYRRRTSNEGKKAGNIADFCRQWGRRYAHMIVLDADSVIAGELIVKMVRLMQLHPEVGIIQTIPTAVNRGTFLARFLQFAGRLNGPTLATGLCFWHLGDSNYWGHNAIIRVGSFAGSCGLPVLPGRAPLGGEILSHDFVEAALMLRGGDSVWLLPDTEGSYEEVPTNLIDFAKRDRRWCQGNLQHTKLFLTPGFRPLSRVHLVMGVLAFVSPLLWCTLLALSTSEILEAAWVGPRYFAAGRSLFPIWPVSKEMERISLYAVSMGLLLVPKLLSLLLAMMNSEDRRGFGGAWALLKSTVVEIVFSTLLAPVMMLFHSQFVLSILLRYSVSWGAQSRDDRGIGFREAFRRHAWHTIIGVIWALVIGVFAPRYLTWLAPVLIGLVLSIPLSYLSSRLSVGEWSRRWGVLAIPEEHAPPVVLQTLEAILRRAPSSAPVTLALDARVPPPAPLEMLPQSVTDPFVPRWEPAPERLR